MPKLPTAKDVKKARKQATVAVTDALEQARTPLFAVLGAGDLATEAVRDYVTKARGEATDQAKDVQARVTELQTKLSELQDRLVEVRAQVRTKVGELPDDVAELRGRFEPAELRGALESYVQSLQDVYEKLAARGETAADKLRKQPKVKQAIDRVEATADTAEVRVGKIVDEAREIADDVLGRVTRRTRSVGEKTAIATEKAADDTAQAIRKAADDVSDAVEEAGDEAASTTRSVSRKAANRTAPAKPATRRATATTRRTGTKA
jgi:heparin binding hemagglutinin HbhA